MENILKCLFRLVSKPTSNIIDAVSHGNNRINNAGDALERYVKDILANTLGEKDEKIRLNKWEKVFSYYGNTSNPPDAMLRGGDAIETKKVESSSSALALNSSYPKAKLYSDSTMINNSCRTAENWTEKDIVYAVGEVNKSRLKTLWFIYGDCFAAHKNIYEGVKLKISSGINLIPNVEFTQTNELGRIKKVDPLGVTDLRIRGMWHIASPTKIFGYLNCYDKTKAFQIISIMKSSKFNSYRLSDKNALLQLRKAGYSITDERIKDPNNPANLIDIKLIKLSLDSI